MSFARLLAALAVAAFAVHTAGAQPHTGSYLTVGTTITRVDTSGVVTTLYDNPGICHGVTMDVDNRTAWFGHTFSANQSGLFKLDLQTNAVTTVLVDPNVAYGPRDLAIDGNGDLLFTSLSRVASNPTRFDYRLFKRSGQTITTVAVAPTAARWFGGMAIDVRSGHAVVQDRATTSPAAPLLRIEDGGAVTTLATGLDPRYSIAQELVTGDWYSGSFGSYMVVSGGVPTTVTPSATAVYYAMALDRASAIAPRMVSQNDDTLWFTDLATGVVTAVALQESTGTRYELAFERGRNLATVRTAPSRWSIRISFPGEGGNRYVLAAGLAGTSPAIPLGDGRRIPLALDPLVTLTLQNLIKPLFDPGPRVLDAAGEATGSLDLSSLPPLGVPLTIAGMTLSTTGVGTVADPIVLRL